MLETNPASPATAIILLAAGNSSRMGQAKQLLDFCGKPLLRYTAEVALESQCGPVVVVLGARANELRPALDGLPVQIVENDRWPEGMGSSIQTGLRALQDAAALSSTTGAILALADQPFVSSAFLRSLADLHHTSGKQIIASRYSGTVGVPVYFSRDAFPLLMALKPDQGCKGVILGHPSNTHLVDCPDAALDIDTPEDYAKALTASSAAILA
jgi:molybdenum cofactor cytidylyltransferase